ncbi:MULTISPECIES: hypothetical protein [unclassified Microbacterium]|uniref:hypothetical protein n=1 Tax=unclassified Microbacterium TaxID=2609290 RepID=UPI0034406DB0
MSDTGSADETPMIPEELVPRQTSDDPVANDPDAAGVANDEGEAGHGHPDHRRGQDEDDDRIDLNDLA